MNDRTWWISRGKQYEPDTKRWYCSMCCKRTPIERNPEWDGSYKGIGEPPAWFVRCGTCGREHFGPIKGECTNCGFDGFDCDEDPTLISIDNFSSSSYASYKFGIDGHTWNETHQCPLCHKIFTFGNADF